MKHFSSEPVEIPVTPILKRIYASSPRRYFWGSLSYVYSDIVYQLVGDSHVPLLRCINITPEVGRMPTLTYDKPHYTSLSKSVIDDMEISLNDQNQYIPFTYGKVIVKLHFRPVKQYF